MFTLHYTTLHYTTLHYITLHYIQTFIHVYVHSYIHTYRPADTPTYRGQRVRVGTGQDWLNRKGQI